MKNFSEINRALAAKTTKLFTLLLAVAASIGTMFAWDYEKVQIGDLYYNLDAATQTAEVTKLNSGEYAGNITISSSVTYNSVNYSVTSIGDYAFERCSGLTSITIPNSVTSIGNHAFRNCSSLTSIEIPSSVTSIGNSAFRNCSSLTSIEIPSSVTSIGNYAFTGCTGSTSVTIPNSVTKIEEGVFSGCTGLTSVTIPDNVTSIATGAFEGCTGLTSITISNSVTSIGNNAFRNCSSLTSVTIPNGVISIGYSAFRNCTGLISITIPNSVTIIRNWAFQYCNSLTSIEIPNSVKNIGEAAFEGCSGLTSLTCIATTPPTLGDNVFSSVDKSISLYVPAQSVDLYKATDQWREFNIQPLPSYTITWKQDDGTTIDQTTVEYGVVPTHADPTKPATAEFSYTFAGWTPEVVSVTGDATYTAIFTPTIREYAVTFKDDDGSIISSQIYQYGQMPIVPADPTKAATAEYTYIFVSWDKTVTTVTGDVVYTAIYNATKNSYTITWQNEDGSLIDQTTVEYGIVPTHADPTKPATAEYTYTFAGWTPTVVSVTGDATYQATFNATKNSYTITWKQDDGTTIDQTTVEYGVVPTHADPTKPATAEFTYTFAGWTPEVTQVTGNATYTATYSITLNKYDITFEVKGNPTRSQTIADVPYGTLISSLVGQVKEALGGDTFEDDQYIYTYEGLENVESTDIVTANATYYVLYSKTEKPSTSLNNVECTSPARKLYINGVLYIEHNGLLFNAQGARVK